MRNQLQQIAVRREGSEQGWRSMLGQGLGSLLDSEVDVFVWRGRWQWVLRCGSISVQLLS